VRPSLPTGSYFYEAKYDGHRLIMRREADRVRCQSRAGRDSTRSWPDLVAAGMALEPGMILDGEGAVYRSGRVDFACRCLYA
jgi:ATP-dependent DNA ligase